MNGGLIDPVERTLRSDLRVRRERGDFDLFLSHNKKDREAVLKIDAWFQERGVLCWLDERELEFGRSWMKGLERALEETPSALVVYGPHGEGPWQREEIEYLIHERVKKGKQVIPVVLEGVNAQTVLSPLMKSSQAVCLKDDNDLSPLQDLVKRMVGSPESPVCADGGVMTPDEVERLLELAGQLPITRAKIQRLALLSTGWSWIDAQGMVETLRRLSGNSKQDTLLTFAEFLRRMASGILGQQIGRWVFEACARRNLDYGSIQRQVKKRQEERRELADSGEPRLQVVIRNGADLGSGTPDGSYVLSSCLLLGAKHDPDDADLLFSDISVPNIEWLKFHLREILQDALDLLGLFGDPPRRTLLQLFVPLDLLDYPFERLEFVDTLTLQTRKLREFWPVVVAPYERHFDRGWDASLLHGQRQERLEELRGPNPDRILDWEEEDAGPDELEKRLCDVRPHAFCGGCMNLVRDESSRCLQYLTHLVNSSLPAATWLREVPYLGGESPLSILLDALGNRVVDWHHRIYELRISSLTLSWLRDGIAFLWDDEVAPPKPTQFRAT